MQFFSALSGWQWFLVAAVPVGIFALYFLKLRRKPLEVPSTFLWKRSIEDLQVNSLWQRLRRSILLLLQLLAVAALLFALLRPSIDTMQTGKHLVLVIDNSASMSATDVSPRRLDLAKRQATEIVEQMKPGDVAMVISFADSAQVASSYTQNASTLKQAIAGIGPTSRTTDLREALTIASGLANPQTTGDDDAAPIPATMYLFSDGDFPAVTDMPLGNLSLRYVAVGKSSNNVGMVSMGARRNLETPDRWQVFARLRNFSAEKKNLQAELTVDGARQDIQAVEIPANETTAIVFRLAALEAAVIGVRFGAKDDLPLDNAAWTVIHPPRKVRILVIGPENPILRSALGTESVTTVADVEFRPADFAAQDLANDATAGTFDLVIFDRCAPKSMPDANTFFLGAVPPSLAAVEKTTVRNPIILNWTSMHPVLRYLSLEDVSIVEAFTIPLPSNARSLIESDKGPILFRLPRQGRTDIVQTFPLVGEDGNWKTDWPLKLSFPLYVMNIIRHLAGAESTEQTSYVAGSAITIPGSGNAETARITLPSGRVEQVRRSARGTFDFLSTDELGVYTVEIGDEKRPFAVNLLSDAESAIKPRDQVAIGAAEAKDESAEIVSRRELWKPLTLLAIGLLLFEWYIFHRRVYV